MVGSGMPWSHRHNSTLHTLVRNKITSPSFKAASPGNAITIQYNSSPHYQYGMIVNDIMICIGAPNHSTLHRLMGNKMTSPSSKAASTGNPIAIQDNSTP